MSKVREIASGYKNLLKSALGISSEKDEEIFNARRSVCNACPNRSALDRCLKCGCPLAAKTRSLDPNNDCPEKYW